MFGGSFKKIVRNPKIRRRSEKFQIDLDNLFDIAHADALERMKIKEDKMFLHRQREPGHPGCLVRVDKKNC